jgi:hypothetical protein
MTHSVKYQTIPTKKINHRQAYISAVTTRAMDLALKQYFNKLKHYMSVARLS